MKNIKMPSKIRKQKLAMLCVGVSPFEKLSFNKVYEPWMKALMDAMGECDWTDKKYLKPLLEYIW